MLFLKTIRKWEDSINNDLKERGRKAAEWIDLDPDKYTCQATGEFDNEPSNLRSGNNLLRGVRQLGC